MSVKRGNRSGITPAINTAAPAPAPQPTPPQPVQTSGLVSDTGVQNMDDATLTALFQRAMAASITRDGRQDTPAQRIADALGISANKPESVPQEALAQYRSQTYNNGTLYRTVDDAGGGLSGRQIAHDLTDSTDYGLNFGGGRVYGVGLYFAGRGSHDSTSAANHSSRYGGGSRWGSYTIEAHLKPTARIATDGDLSGAKARSWALAHKRALNAAGFHVTNVGVVGARRSSGMSDNDVKTTVAMLMGYDGYHNGRSNVPYYTIFNRGALQVARGNKYDRADRGSI